MMVALRRPSPPIMAIYIHEIGRMLAEPQGAAETAPLSPCLPAAGFTPSTTAWPGRKGARCALHANGSHARPATTVGNAEGFVQVHVAHVRPQFRRAHDADLRVEVGAIEINLPAVVMDSLADVDDALLQTRHGSKDR